MKRSGLLLSALAGALVLGLGLCGWLRSAPWLASGASTTDTLSSAAYQYRQCQPRYSSSLHYLLRR
jgi:hypothetical protein